MITDNCCLCPRRCPSRANGLCGERDFTHARVAKTMLHRWEEPCVSGARGTGAVFFAGCNLRCVFCQNHRISQPRPVGAACQPPAYEQADAPRLAEQFWRLHAEGAESISLISPTHVLPVAREAMRLAKGQGFPLRFVWNSNAYENPEALRTLEGLVGLYLPDLKYFDDAMALAYSAAPAYFAHACAAIKEMSRQGEVLIRHMVLPGGRKDSMRVLDWIAENVPGAKISLLAQYTPMYRAAEHPPLHRRLTAFEYESAAEYALSLGLQGYFQQREAATDAYTPNFHA
ncbi:MAG: radical SAM protein [Firmicutes bacterium]|nr:radical SAM protein [Bacillota bacterium]